MGKNGVEARIYPPGSTYFFIPFINDWHTFDTKLQNIEMTFNARSGDIQARDDLLFKTIDGNDISLDVIVSYRIIPEKAPYILQYVAKNDLDLRQNIVRVISRSRPRDIFGELRTEEFYNAENRFAKAQKVKSVLNNMLEDYGVIIEKVLTKDYRFNESYQKAIEDKKIADQKTEQNKSASKAKKEEYNRKLEEAKGEVNKMIAKIDGDYKQAKIEADAYFEKQKLLAKAIQTEGISEAKGIRKMNLALAGSGGDTMVKLKIAESLQGKNILLVPGNQGLDLKTTNINKLLSSYGLNSLKNQPSTKKSTGK